MVFIGIPLISTPSPKRCIFWTSDFWPHLVSWHWSFCFRDKNRANKLLVYDQSCTLSQTAPKQNAFGG